jgi:inhibitor of growth protein 3
MPRDDLTIDFNRHKMPQIEHQDAAAVLDDFVNRVANLPEEIKHMQGEIAEKDRQMQICMDIINSRDASIQKWIRLNGSKMPNPKEDQLRKVVLENYDKVQLLQDEKVALAQKSQQAIDRHIRYLDTHIKTLQDRGEFPTDPDIPSLLRPAAPDRFIGRAEASSTTIPSNHIHPVSSIPHISRSGQQAIPQRLVATQLSQQQIHNGISVSAPATPAAALLLNRQARESSAGAVPKRQRIAGGIATAPGASSGLARRSSIGPATPKAGTPGSTRAGSAQPRGSQKALGTSRKLAPHKLNAVSRKGKPGKSGLSHVKRSGNKNSPSSTNDSELSDAESGSVDEEDETATPPPIHRDADGDEDMLDLDDDEGGDDKKYCTCQSVSYGDMVACDNENCPYEWFHWTCVGLKSEPVGTWICPVCTKNMKR